MSDIPIPPGSEINPVLGLYRLLSDGQAPKGIPGTAEAQNAAQGLARGPIVTKPLHPRPPVDRDALRALVNAAHEEVFALCKGSIRTGGKEFRMSVPADPQRDSDLILSAALDPIPALLDELDATDGDLIVALREVADLRQQLAAIRDAARKACEYVGCMSTVDDPDGDCDCVMHALQRAVLAEVSR